MKKILLLILFVIPYYFGYAVTYYFQPVQNDLTVLANWGINTNGSGTPPTSFTVAGDVFILTSDEVLNSNWLMNQTLQIGLTTLAGINLTVQSGGGYINAATINIPAATSGTHTLQMDRETFPNFGTLHATSTVIYSVWGNQWVRNGVYGNIIINNGGQKTIFTTTSTFQINGNLAINGGATLILPAGGASPTITGNFTTTSNNPDWSILLINATSTTPITANITYNFRVEYNSTAAQTFIPGIFNNKVEIRGNRNVNVNCVPLGVYNFTLNDNNNPGPFNNGLDGSGNSEYGTGFGLITSTSTFIFSGSGNQRIVSSRLTYFNLTLSNNGNKEVGLVPVSNILSVQGDAYPISDAIYGATTILEYRNFTTNPRTRSGLGFSWKDQMFGGTNDPKFIRVADGATINMNDVFPSQTRLLIPLEIIGSGRVNVNNNCRLDLFRNLTTSGGGQLGGVVGSRIHVSGVSNVNIGKINSLGFVNLDKDDGTATITDNLDAGELYVWNPADGSLGNGGTYTFNGNPAAPARINAGSLTIGFAPPGTLPVAAHINPSTGLRLVLNNFALASGATQEHNINGFVNIVDGILDFSNQNTADNQSVILNVAGNFTKTGGAIRSSNPSTSGSFGRMNFNGATQNIFNSTAGSTSTEVAFRVASPSVSTLTNNFEINNGSESFEVDNGGTLVFDATRLITSGGANGTFSLNAGGTVRTANLAGINSTGATGSIRSGVRTFNSGGSLHYNGGAAQNTGIFTTTPSALTINNLTVENAANVTGQQAFTVNGACTLTNGKFIIGTPQLMTLNGTFSGSAVNSIRASGLDNFFIGGSGALGTLFFDNTTAGKSSGTGPTDFVPLTIGTTNRLNNLTINRPGGSAILGNEVQISNTVNPTAGTLNSGSGFLVMLSTSTISSSIGPITTGTSDITGNVNVQSFFTGGFYLTFRGTRMISSPIQEVAFPNNFFRRMRDRFVITGPGGVANGFDAGGVKKPFATTLIRYVEVGTPALSFGTIDNINEAITIGRGYFFFFRGNKSNSATASPAPSKTNDAPGEVFLPVEDWTATYIGNINKGDITYGGLTRTTTGGDLYAGFHVLGNPYPSTLNFTTFRAGNSIVDDYICVVKRDRTGYVVRSGGHNNNTTNPLAIFGSSNIPDDLRNIQPGQGFYVRINAAGSVTFRETHKAAGTAPVRLLEARERVVGLGSNNSLPVNKDKVLRYFIQDTVSYEQATIVFGDNNDANYKDYDAAYLGGSVLGTSTLTADNKNVCINFMPALDAVEQLKISVSAIESNNILKLNFSEIKDITSTKELVLQDNYLNTLTRLDTANNKYNFAINKAIRATFGNNRFVLLLKQRAMLTSDFKVKKQNAGNLISWTATKEINADSCIIEKSIDGIKFSPLKNIKLSGNTSIATNYAHLDGNPNIGLNYYRLKVVDTQSQYTYSDVISVNYDLQTSSLVSIYPNAVKDILNISIRPVRTATINIQILDLSGKLLKSYENINQSDVSRNVSDLNSGIYILKIKDYITNQNIFTGKFIKE